jgi:hypothetical protein
MCDTNAIGTQLNYGSTMKFNRYKTKSWIRTRLNMGLGEMIRPELMDGPFDNFWFEKELLNYYKFYQ